MNLENITLKSYILALIIRDDGERFLLGDGAYEFKQSQLHFNPNTYANDVVELQGSDGQMLAGQVRRTQTQTFDGYIGDATTSKDKVEQYRRAFFMFFRKKHYYTVAYIFANGSSIQRRRGYITDAPSVQELWQKFPEYHIGLNFEDPNYYEYVEDENGNEIYAHIMSINLSSNITGGLIWDAIGAITNAINWKSAQAAQGTYINITNSLDIPAALSEVEIKGNSVQSGTPTPDAPIPVQTVTGENDLEIVGKNLFGGLTEYYVSYCTYTLANNILTITPADTTHNPGVGFILGTSIASGSTVHLSNATSIGASTQLRDSSNTVVANFGSGTNTTKTLTGTADRIVFNWFATGSTTPFTVDLSTLQIELGSTATTYEPYQGQEFEVNLGKNLCAPANIKNGCFVDYSQLADENYTETYNTKYRVIRFDSLPAGTYTFSINWNATARILRIGADGQLITVGRDANTYTFTTTTNGLFGLTFRNTSATNFSDDDFTIQLEKGSTATTYAPYFTPIELCKIGSYQDKIYKSGGKWYVRKEVGKSYFDGSESWQAQSMTSGNNFYRQAGTGAKTNTSDLLNNQGLGRTFTSSEQNVPAGSCFISNSGNLNFLAPDYNDSTAFRTHLSSSPMTLYFPLATPTDTEITNSALIEQLEALGNSKLYVGANNITTTYTEGNAQATLKLGYYTDYDMDGTGYEWEDGGNPRNIVSVDGVDDAQPIWEVVGPAQNPTITNITTGQTLTWNGFVPSGQTLTIDMGEMTATLAGANVFEYISGTWITLDAGNNIITYSASGGATDPSTLSWNGVVG